MILSWKILWFQRVSEHVLELGHYEIKESKVCITHFDCVKKKHILYMYHSDAHESRLVLFISSYWLIHTLFRCSSLTSYPALCLLQGNWGVLLLWFVWSYSTVKMWGHVYSKESTYQPTVWPVVIRYIQYFFVCLIFLQCWSHSFCRQDHLIEMVEGQPGQKKTRGRRIQPFTLWTPRIRSIGPITGNDTTILLEKLCDK